MALPPPTAAHPDVSGHHTKTLQPWRLLRRGGPRRGQGGRAQAGVCAVPGRPDLVCQDIVGDKHDSQLLLARKLVT